MLIAIIGENCTGKSTLAGQICDRLPAKIYAGKDYLRLEKNPSAALERFKGVLQESVSGENIIYIITEKEHLSLLPEKAFRIVLTARLDVIKARFRARMRGTLPPPLEKMLEARHGMYDTLPCQLRLAENYDLDAVMAALGQF